MQQHIFLRSATPHQVAIGWFNLTFERILGAGVSLKLARTERQKRGYNNIRYGF